MFLFFSEANSILSKTAILSHPRQTQNMRTRQPQPGQNPIPLSKPRTFSLDCNSSIHVLDSIILWQSDCQNRHQEPGTIPIFSPQILPVGQLNQHMVLYNPMTPSPDNKSNRKKDTTIGKYTILREINNWSPLSLKMDTIKQTSYYFTNSILLHSYSFQLHTDDYCTNHQWRPSNIGSNTKVCWTMINKITAFFKRFC